MENLRHTRHPNRPRDAATLILVQRDGNEPHVLMGRRSPRHRFMPGKFVFPGGGVERGDSRVCAVTDLRPEVQARLTTGTTPGRARALAMAAIRETFEETGVMLARQVPRKQCSRSRSWAPFAQRGVAPALDVLDFVARAITPPGETRRFDARFFMTSARHALGSPSPHLEGSGELLSLAWVPLREARNLDLPGVTRFVLGEIEKRLSLTPAEADRLGIPFLHFRGRKHLIEEL